MTALDNLPAYGTDKQFREWIQRQPSCITGRFSEWENGEGRNPACHVRRAATSGTGYKAPYSCLPLTHDEHRLQHQYGELKCLQSFVGIDRLSKLLGGRVHSPEAAKQFFDDQVQKYRRLWIESVSGKASDPGADS